jgi:MFS transporter, DHA1 family, multidrug resistance protein
MTEVKIKNYFVFLFVVMAMAVLVNFCLDSYLPSVPFIARALGTDVSNAQLGFAMTEIGIGLGNLIIGIFLINHTRRKLCFLNLFICIIGEILCLTSPNIYIFIVARIITGFSIGGIISISVAAMCDIYHGEKLAKINAYLMLILAVTPAIGPLVGGYIQRSFGWRHNFILPIVLLIIMLVTSFFLFPETFDTESRINKKFTTLTREFLYPLRDIKFITVVLCTVFCWGSILAYIAIGPQLFEISLKLSPASYGNLAIYTAIALICSSILNSIYITKLGFKKVMFFGIIVAFVGVIMLFFFYFIGLFNVLVIVLPVSIFIFGINFAYGNLLPLSTEVYTNAIGNPAVLFVFLEVSAGALLAILAAYIPVQTQFWFAIILMLSSVMAFILLFIIFRDFYHNRNL